VKGRYDPVQTGIQDKILSFPSSKAGVRVYPSPILGLAWRGMGIIRERVPLRSLLYRSCMKRTETIRCHGHRNVLSLHPTTFEITKDLHITCKGDCIVAVGADKGAADLSPEFREALARDDAVLLTKLTCGEISVKVTSQGSAGMTLVHTTDLVWRKSDYVCGRTIGIGTEVAAKDLPRELIECLRNGEELVVEMTVTNGNPVREQESLSGL